MLLPAFLCFLVFTKVVTCTWPFGTNFLFWFWQSAVVVDQWLYIEGGEYYTLDGNKINPNPLTSTLSIDLSQSWTIASVSAQNNSKPSTMAPVRRPPLWYDPFTNVVMERGGWAYGPASYDLWSFSPDGKGSAVWSLNGTASADATQLVATFGGAFTASTTNFYSLGGTIPSSNVSLEGFTSYDFATRTWRNSSSLASLRSGYSVQGQATFLPNFGDAGLLVFLGGDSPPNQTYQYEAGVALVDMSNITIYDPTRDTWYHQTATGSVPPPRSEFCAVGSAAKDNSSYEIYAFGGSTNSTFDIQNAADTGYLDVFILSMPSFVWFKAGTTTEARRANHFCHVVGRGQMLVIGGRNPSQNISASAAGFWNNVDPWTRGMNIFDMNSLNWTGAYNAGSTYDRPAVIQQYYASHANDTNWSDPALAALFTPRQVASPGSHTTSPSQTATPQSNTGAIVGGVVGGVGALLIILASGFIFVRRRRRRTASSRPNIPSHEMPHNQKYEKAHQQTYEMENPPVEMPAMGNPHGTQSASVELPAGLSQDQSLATKTQK